MLVIHLGLLTMKKYKEVEEARMRSKGRNKVKILETVNIIGLQQKQQDFHIQHERSVYANDKGHMQHERSVYANDKGHMQHERSVYANDKGEMQYYK